MLLNHFLQADGPLLQHRARAGEHAGDCPPAVLPTRPGRPVALAAGDEVLHLADVGPLEALWPAAVDGRDQPLVAVHADDDVLRPHRADLHDAFLADDFDPRVVAIVAGTDTGEA